MIASSTLTFLKSVAENNNREWFQDHKSEYTAARENVLDFTEKVIKGLARFDPSIPSDLPAKDCVMRIYRDIRFSKDKSPLKTNFGIAISSAGKNFKGPGYYVHIKPGECFIAGGSWFPPADELKSIRQEIDYNAEDWHRVIDDPEFVSLFGKPDTEGKLRTAPKGYTPDHPEIEFLKLKSFTMVRKVSDRDLTSDESVEYVTGMFEKLYPFMLFLRNAIS